MKIEYREQIDKLDEKIVKLFCERMEVCEKIAEFKKENDLPVFDPKREREKLQSVADMSPDDIKDYTRLLYSLMFELSRSYQKSRINTGSELAVKIRTALDNTPKLFPEGASVACQGTDGAYSQLACNKVFRNANIMFFSTFEAVFSAVEKGLCSYGVIPVENSTAGTVNSVYDLMLKHKFSIVRSARVKVDHNLLVRPGTKMSDIKEIYSHPQAIAQCQNFLSGFTGVKIIPCENTAVAAEMVAKSDTNTTASLSSRSCMRNFGLDCLAESVQDKGNNYTRFICISRDLEIYPGADRTSLMAFLPHEPGSLYRMLARFNALGINLLKIESRPIPERDFEFMFYFDIETPVYADRFTRLMNELNEITESCHYLGSYSEVI